MKEVTREEALQAQKDNKVIKVTSDIYPNGLSFKPWEYHSIYFVGHNCLKYYIM